MKQSTKTGVFPWVPLFAGLLGFALRSWLFSSMEKGGLLPQWHIAGVLPFVLLGITMALTFWGTRQLQAETCESLFPASKASAALCFAGATGLGFAAFAPGSGVLKYLAVIFGLISMLALFYGAACRGKGLRIDPLIFCTPVVYFIFRTMISCRNWGSEPQFQLFFFELLACLLLMMAFYYRAQLALNGKGAKAYLFFGQSALFCCCLSLAGGDFLFYLSAGIWLTGDLCAFSPVPTDN